MKFPSSVCRKCPRLVIDMSDAGPQLLTFWNSHFQGCDLFSQVFLFATAVAPKGINIGVSNRKNTLGFSSSFWTPPWVSSTFSKSELGNICWFHPGSKPFSTECSTTYVHRYAQAHPSIAQHKILTWKAWVTDWKTRIGAPLVRSNNLVLALVIPISGCTRLFPVGSSPALNVKKMSLSLVHLLMPALTNSLRAWRYHFNQKC